MEKRQSSDYYLPFAITKLVRAAGLIRDIIKCGQGFDGLGETRRIFLTLFSNILEAGEKINGPFLFLEEMGINKPIPTKWIPVLRYLKKENLIERIFTEPIYYDTPKLIKTHVIAPFDMRLTDGHRPLSLSNFAHGVSKDIDESIGRAIGEFLERFTLLIYREKDLIRTSVKELRKKNQPHLNIQDLAGFSEEQKLIFKRYRFSEESDFLWAKCRSLFTNENVLIPAQLIFWNFNCNHKTWQESSLREENTNGAGAYFTPREAVLSGLYELIQRDGFLIYWLNHQAPPQIAIETIDFEPLRELIEESHRLGFEVRFYNTTTDIDVPSCVCTFFDHANGMPKISLGAGCGMDWDRILLRSFDEAYSVHNWSRKRMERMNNKDAVCIKKDYKPFRDFSFGQVERLLLWANEKMSNRFQFFLNGKTQSLKEVKLKVPKFSTSEDEINYLIKKFQLFGNGYEIYYYQAKQKALDDLGYFSVKVVVPALLPLYLREAHAPLGTKRLKEVPEKLGFKTAEKWNPWPHPFP